MQMYLDRIDVYKRQVQPRAEMVGSNAQILTQLRADGDDLYMYAWNYCDSQNCGLDHGLNANTDVSVEGLYVPYELSLIHILQK